MNESNPNQQPALVVVEGPLAGSRFTLSGSSQVIGRPDDKHHLYPDIDLSAADPHTPPSLTRRHARIVRSPTGLTIQDLGSTNGTLINDYLATIDQATPLYHGDRLRFGNVAVVLEAPAFVRLPAALPKRPAEAPPAVPAAPVELTEQHFTIRYGDTGHTYDSVFGSYLAGAKDVFIEDPYIRAPHQVQNFIRFCETVINKGPTIRCVRLKTGYDEKTDLAMVKDRMGELKESLLGHEVILDIEFSQSIHDREIRLDNGWIIKIGRGLDFYQRPDSRFAVGASDLSLRKCLETKIDIFRV